MKQQLNTALFTPLEYATSLTCWWSQAGLDYNVQENSTSWLELGVRNVSDIPNNTKRHAKLRVTTRDSSLDNIEVNKEAWPQSIVAFQNAIAAGAKLPGNSYSVKSAVAIGPQYAALMVIYDLPDADEIEAGKVASGKSGRLLYNMLKAAGFLPEECFITSLASSRPAVGELPPSDTVNLAEFMRHQIGLVRPKRILILGSAACQALLNADLMSSRGNLANINHDDEVIDTVVTFHPRTLLMQPNMKAQAWGDLQKLITEATL